MSEFTHSSADRPTTRDQVARHPMVAFVSLAYAISWTAWLFTYQIDLGTVNGFGIIGAAAPALAAMIVSAILRPEPSGIPNNKRWRLLGILWASILVVLIIRRLWVVAGLTTVTGRAATTIVYPQLWALLLDALAAVVVAFVLTGFYSSRQGVRDVLHSLDPRCQPVRWYWWLIAVGIYPIVIALGNAISAGVGLPGATPKVTGLWYWQMLDALVLFLLVLLGGGGLEEPGWRGFALPLLQKHYSPLRSSLILAVIWALWHWPLFWFGESQGGLLGVIFFLFGVAPVAILFTAVFNLSGGSLPIAILLHSSINITGTYLPPSMIATSVWMLLILGVAVWMWRSPQTYAPRPVESL